MQAIIVLDRIAPKLLSIGIASVLLLGFHASTSATPPTRDELDRQAARCHDMLVRSVVDFYLPNSIDRINGGYLEDLASDGTFAPGEGKFLTLQARQLWLFSTLADNDIRRDEALAAARVGYDFLQQHFHDKDHDGYFSRVTMDGSPQDTRKHTYLNSFAIYGLVAYYRAAQDQHALDAAVRLFDVLEKKAYDRQHGGYQEFFYADWKPITDPREPRYVGAINTKTYNTHLHLLESFTELYRVSPQPLLARRLSELMLINMRTVQHPKYPCNIDGWTRDWTMIPDDQNLRASYGHDVECAWLVFDAARAMNWPLDPLRSWAVSLVDSSLHNGYDMQHGGFFYTGPLGQASDDRRKEWWVQSEALVSMLEMYRLTRDEKYYTAFAATLDFIDKHQVDHEHGGWWATRNEDGSPHANISRSSSWQGGYHNGRALLLSGQLLKELAAHAE